MFRDDEIATAINDACFSGDTEIDHMKADGIVAELLRELGYTEVVLAWQRVEKWYA